MNHLPKHRWSHRNIAKSTLPCLQSSWRIGRLVIALLASLNLSAAAYAELASTPPTFTKAFSPASIGPGSYSTLTFTIDNSAGTSLTGMAFTDNLPAGLQVASPAQLSSNCATSETSTTNAMEGSGNLSINDYSLAGGAICTISVNVTSSMASIYTNISGDLTSSAGNSGPAQADLTVITGVPGFSKQFTPSSVPLGNSSRLTYTLDNSANDLAVTYAQFTDELPTGVRIKNPANVSTDCGQLSFNLTATPDTNAISLLASGFNAPGFEVLVANASCSISMDVVTESIGLLQSVSSNLDVRVGNNVVLASVGKAGATLDVTITPVALRKRFVNNPVSPGGTAELELIATNYDRNSAATNVAFTDDLDATLTGLTVSEITSSDCGMVSGTSTLSLAGGTIEPGVSCTINALLTVPAAAAAGSYPNTTSNITATVDGEPIIGNSATDNLIVSSAPIVTARYIDDPVSPGGTVTIEYTVQNTSSTAGATGIEFSHPYPTVLPSASTVPSAECCGAGSECSFTPLNNPPPPQNVVPASFNLDLGTLAPAGQMGDMCTFTLTLDVVPEAPSGAFASSTTAPTAEVDSEILTGQPASDALLIVAAPSLSKSFLSSPVAPGATTTLQFTLTHSADANTPATDIAFTDDLDAMLAGTTVTLPMLAEPACGVGSVLSASAGDSLLSLTDGTLQPGEQCTFSVDVNIPAASPVGEVTNTTSAVSATVEAIATTSSAATVDLAITGLSISKAFLENPVIPGSVVTLRYTIENNDPTNEASGIVFNEDYFAILPGTPDITMSNLMSFAACGGMVTPVNPSFLSFSGGSIGAGDPPCTFDIGLTVPLGAADGDYTSASSAPTASVNATLLSLAPVTDTLEVLGAQLLLTKEFIDDPVAPGDLVTLEFSLTNLNASSAATDIAFSDDLGAALTGLTAAGLVESDCTGLEIAGAMTTSLSFSAISLGAGASCAFSINLAVPANADAGAYLNTTSQVSGVINGLNVSGTAASDELVVQEYLQFSKAFNGPSAATRTAVLTFTIVNSGDQDVANLAFTDDLNAVIPGLVATNLPATPCGESSSLLGTSTLIFSGGEVARSGGSCTFDVEVLVPASATAGTFTNTTSILTSAGIQVGLPATDDLVIEPAPGFSKGFKPNTLDTSGTTPATLTFTVSNFTSALAASELSFTDNLPASITVANPANASTTCTGGSLIATPGTGTITYSGGTVDAGSFCQVIVDTIGTTPGVYVNTSGDLTSSNGNSGPATATLTIALRDADFDTIPDHLDNCPTVANTNQTDLDQDGLGDLCDNDIDGDGMPNDWEIANGLDPYNSFDQLADPDGDGFTNLEEYEFRTDPNLPDADDNDNGIPDVVEARGAVIVPNIILPLLLDKQPK